MNIMMLGGIKELTFAGLNVLEWAGLVFLVTGAVYAVRNALRRVRAERRANQPASKPADAPEADFDRGDGRETVLVVDDDPDVLKTHARLIASLGYRVSEAMDGKKAVETVKKEKPDLIVLDLLMGEQDGIETFEAIRKVSPDQRAIVISGYAGPSMVNSIQALGVHTYLVKPVERSILGKAIRDELDRAA